MLLNLYSLAQGTGYFMVTSSLKLLVVIFVYCNACTQACGHLFMYISGHTQAIGHYMLVL